MSVIQQILKRQKLSCPSWLPMNLQFEAVTGSQAYGISTDASDIDIVGFVVPPKDVVFPHLAGEIPGFGRQQKRFDVWQQHHVKDGETEYDLTVYSIVKFFHLCMENNPNMVDVLFSPAHCIRHSTLLAQKVREYRHLFLHKGCYHKFIGYAYSQLNKMRTRKPEGKRKKLIEEYGFDTKYAYHLVRLLLECEQILSTGDLCLDRDKEFLRAVRAGEWTQDRIVKFFEDKERHLEQLYQTSDLPYKPPEGEIKRLLVECLEMHYGDISDGVHLPGTQEKAFRQIKEIAEKALANNRFTCCPGVE